MSEPQTKVCPGCGIEKQNKSFAVYKNHRRKHCNTCRANKLNSQSWSKYFAARLNRAAHVVAIDGDYCVDLLIAQQGRCALSGVLLTRNIRDMRKASIDRIDSSVGYVKGNVRIVAWAANRIKQNMSDEELKDWIVCMNETMP